MNKQDILTLYKYNAWSNAKILDAASGVTLEQLLTPAPFPHGSLRGTLVHALFAEWVWRERWEAPHPLPGCNRSSFQPSNPSVPAGHTKKPSL